MAFALAAAHEDAIRTLAIVDVTLPGIGPDLSQGGKRWHHAFHMTPDLPETLVAGREREYLTWFYRTFSWRREAFDDGAIDEYLRTYREPAALRAGFEYYRNIPQDIADNRGLLASGRRLKLPVLAVGGGRAEARGRGSEPEQSLREIADDVRGFVVADCGHFVPEEAPEELAAAPARALRARLRLRLGGPRRRPVPLSTPSAARPRARRCRRTASSVRRRRSRGRE